jgi:hypothetical protein
MDRARLCPRRLGWTPSIISPSRLLKNAPAYRQAGIYGVFRPAHRLAGVPRVAPYSSQRHPSSFPVSSTGQACCGVPVVPVGNGLKPFPTRHCLPDRQVKSAAGAPVNGISQTQLASACLREVPPCGTKAGAFLSNC